jgi:tripartite-type tricarboxylate transporter receptor subunit TctC
MHTVKRLAAISIPVMLAVPAVHAGQPAYPERPIRLVVGSAAGAGVDIISRALAEQLYGALGQRIVVDNRPGVAGILSAELVLRSAPDGYTWMMLTSQLLVATAVYPDVKFNLEKDFASISLLGTVPFVLVVNPELPAKSIRELIELAKKAPLRYGSAGTGASEHLSAVLFTRMTGTDMLHVPYKGIAQALTDTMGKEVHLTFAILSPVLPLIQAGRVRALGVTVFKRNALLPDVPSISEVVPGYQMFGWAGAVAPTGTPEAVLGKASAEVAKAVKEPQFGERLKAMGWDLVGSSRTGLDAFRREQTKRTSDIVNASGVNVK